MINWLKVELTKALTRAFFAVLATGWYFWLMKIIGPLIARWLNVRYL